MTVHEAHPSDARQPVSAECLIVMSGDGDDDYRQLVATQLVEVGGTLDPVIEADPTRPDLGYDAVFVARCSGKPVGMLGLYSTQEGLYVGRGYVLSAYVRRGLEERLCRAAQLFARDVGYPKIHVRREHTSSTIADLIEADTP